MNYKQDNRINRKLNLIILLLVALTAILIITI